MKQVVFIAGTAYSGSTMIDMMLGNSASSFSLGEVRYFFEPTRSYHINPLCDCGDSSCNIWQKLRKVGKNRFYGELFKQRKDVETIIDSSKDPIWISERRQFLSANGIKSKVILIWKSPEEFALSRYKRNELKGWHQAWIKYHKLLFSLIDDWRSVEYKKIAANPSETLEQLCSIMSLPYVDGMELYWNKKHHMLFGNLSAKYHTQKKGDKKYLSRVNNIEDVAGRIMESNRHLNNKHQKIYYDYNFKDKLPDSVIKKGDSYIFSEILSLINKRSIYAPNYGDNISVDGDVFLSKPQLIICKFKREVKSILFNLKKHKNNCFIFNKSGSRQ